jgi:K+-transporting ATPase KdpF subunit
VRARIPGGRAVSAGNIAGLIVAACLVGYLFLAIRYPEKF